MTHFATRRRVATLGIAAATVLVCGVVPAPVAAQASRYPDKPITIVVPFPAGGSVDAVLRTLQPRLSRELGQPLVIDNIGGAGGSIGASRVAKAPADGYTLLAGSINDVVMAPVLNRDVRYKTQDFQPIGPIISAYALIVARKDLPADNIDGVVARLREKPDSLTFGSPGVGTFQHMVMEDLQTRAGVHMVHVPYKGAGPLVNDVIAGVVDLAVMVPSTALPQIEGGRIKVLGLARQERLPSLKSIPTLNESRSVKGIDANGWMGLFAPRGLSTEQQARLRQALEATLRDPQVLTRLAAMGMEIPTDAERSAFSTQVEKDQVRVRSLSARLQ